jgi:hypothetical protein
MRRNFTSHMDRRTRLVPMAAALTVAIGLTTVASAPAGAATPRLVVTTPLFAYAGGTKTIGTACPADGTDNPSHECSLDRALTFAAAHAAGNQLIELATPGTTAHYLGNWTADLTKSTSAQPMLIQPAPGLAAAPVLDGNDGSVINCTTISCADAILTASGTGFLNVTGFTMTHGNNSASAAGGAIDNVDSSVSVSGMSFVSNAATIDGGAIDNADGGTGTLSVTGSTFTSNSAGADGGAIDSADGGTGTLTVKGSTFTSNNAGTDGGAIDNADTGVGDLTVTGSTFTSNNAGYNGGAIDSADTGSGTATIGTSTLTGNTAGYDGGGIDNGDTSPGPAALVATSLTLIGNTAGYNGGGIDNGDTSAGSVTASISRSTFAQNTAGSAGGALDNGDAAVAPATDTVTVSASTLSANSAPAGGAIANAATSGLGSLTLSSSTLSANTGTTGAGIDNSGGAGSVVAAGDLLADACAPGIAGWTDAGYSAGEATCLNAGPGSTVSTTVTSLLGPLASNGGTTQTLLPLAGNAGIARIPASTSVTLGSGAVALCPTTDQRGVASLNGRPCTTGAVQVAAPVMTSSDHTTFAKGSPGTFTVHATGLPAPTYTETGVLPAGVTLDPASGVLSGSAQTDGVFPVTMRAHNSSGPDAIQAFTLTVPGEGYWLVGGDGGIFTFGSAHFYGSTGAMVLQRPVVAITPTADRSGYWLVASDGGIFAFGNAGYHGSIPGIGLAPAGTPGTAKRLSAPIVGMVPSVDGGGYFMVASDGGVFAFGDAAFTGSCPGIGGCSGAAVAVMPDATGNGYWVVTATGNVYAFGDAPTLGQPGAGPTPVTSAVRTPDGNGYWILYADGPVFPFGDATNFGSPSGLGGASQAAAVFAKADGGGYWVATANGAVHPFGDANFLGDMSASHLNSPVIAASGF